MSPYTQVSFFEFFIVFFKRLFILITGQDTHLYSDEIQIFCLSLVAIIGAVLGSKLVFKKMTMLANALSHTILLGIILSFLIMQGAFNLNGLIIASLLTGLLTTFLVQVLKTKFRLYEDAAVGFVFTTLFALGILMATLYTKSVHLGLESVMGNLDALHVDDLKRLFWIGVINLGISIAFFKEFKLICFDQTYSQTLGFKTGFYNYLLMTQVAFFCVGAFRAVGVVSVLAFLVAPVLMVKHLKSLQKVMLFASVIGVIVTIISVALARHLLSYYNLPVSTAGLTVTVLFFITLVTLSRKKRVQFSKN